MSSEHRPRLLDLFCGAGGAAVGYARAGFEVVGVDIEPQPNYPFEFVRANALNPPEYVGWGPFDAIHASPPCPRYSAITRVQGNPGEHADLVGPTRELLEATGLLYVIENVMGSPLRNAHMFCGAAFNLGAICRDGKHRPLKRHRLFETNVPFLSPGCACDGREPVGVYGGGGPQHKTVRNGGVNRGYMGDSRERQEAMGIDWMGTRELSNAIPPAYTEFIGTQLMAHLKARVAA